jgi:hypothetical protein
MRPASRSRTGADGVSHSDVRPLLLNHESAPARPWPQPRQPDALMERWPRLLILPSAVVRPRPEGRSGGRNEIGARPSQEYGLGAEAPSQCPPDPRQTVAHKKEESPDDPPPPRSLTELASPWGEEPAVFRLAAKRGTNEYRDRPGRVPRHCRPVLRSGAAGVRMRVGCDSSLGQGAASRVRSG